MSFPVLFSEETIHFRFDSDKELRRSFVNESVIALGSSSIFNDVQKSFIPGRDSLNPSGIHITPILVNLTSHSFPLKNYAFIQLEIVKKFSCCAQVIHHEVVCFSEHKHCRERYLARRSEIP